MLFHDPPDHTRLRSLVSKAFTPRSVAELEPRIRRVVQELLDDMEGRDRFDLISDFAFPLPVTVIAEMLGVPAQDIDRFRDWSNDIALTVEPTLDDEQTRRMEESFQELLDYFEDIIERRLKEPQDDMITALLNVEAEGDRLSRGELLATLTLLLVAGNETTRNFIGNGMLALLKHPDQLQRLRDNPDMLDSALDELLRYDSPVQMDQRMVYEDVEIKGHRIRAGQRVINAIGAANRDPEVFANPDKLGHRTQGEEPPVFRARHTLLPRLAARNDGRSHRVLLAARPISLHGTGVRAGVQGADRPEGCGRSLGRGRIEARLA